MLEHKNMEEKKDLEHKGSKEIIENSTEETQDVPKEKEVQEMASEITKQVEEPVEVINIETAKETNEKVVENSEITIEDEENTTETVSSEVVEAVETPVDTLKDVTSKEKEKVVEIAPNYESMDMQQLVDKLSLVISSEPIQKIKSQVDAIKNAFYDQFNALLAEKKEAFLVAGGNVIDFQFTIPIKGDFTKLLKEYRAKRDAYYADLEQSLKNNLAKREEVIERLKTLIEKGDGASMYKNFKEIETEWKKIGPVPKQKYNDTWKIYYHHVERFYDLLHLSNDFRELDFKHNLEAKIKIVDRAEVLTEAEDVNTAFKELQELHKKWKEIGPVSRDIREEIWQRFSEATKKTHSKRHAYFKVLDSKHDEIITEKLAIIAKIETYDTSQNKSHNDWQKSVAEVEKIRNEYFKTPKLPHNKSEKIWQKLKEATKKFNSAKNAFYKGEKSEQLQNLAKKRALIEIALSVKDSDDWDVATNIVKKVQADWKKIGYVPRKFSDEIWKQFKDACNHYFDRLHENKNALNQEQQAFVDQKEAFLKSIDTKNTSSVEAVKELMIQWRALGSLPKGARELENQFNAKIDEILGGLNLDSSSIKLLKFKNVVDGYVANNDVQKLDGELIFIRKKIDEIVKEIQQLENNLGFFSTTNDSNPLLQNVKNNINNHKNELDGWKLKLSYLRKLSY